MTVFHRYIFLFDKVVIVCKRKGYSYELKEIIELQSYKMSDDPMNNRDMKKVRPQIMSAASHSPSQLTLPTVNFARCGLWMGTSLEN